MKENIFENFNSADYIYSYNDYNIFIIKNIYNLKN